MLLHWLKAWFRLAQSILGSGIHGAHSASSDQPYGRRPGRKLRADSARRAPGAGPGRQPDGDVGAGADGVSAARPADERRLRAARLDEADGPGGETARPPASAGGRGDAEPVGEGAAAVPQRGAILILEGESPLADL